MAPTPKPQFYRRRGSLFMKQHFSIPGRSAPGLRDAFDFINSTRTDWCSDSLWKKEKENLDKGLEKTKKVFSRGLQKPSQVSQPSMKKF
jgi:hypothetical protein